MNLIASAEDWLFQKALGKALRVAAMGAGSYLLAHAGFLHSWGVSVTVDPDVLAAGFMAGAEVVRNWVKFKLTKGE